MLLLIKHKVSIIRAANEAGSSWEKLNSKWEEKMWWIVSVILAPLLIGSALITTFFVMVVLNGYPSIPDALAGIYLAAALVLTSLLSIMAGRTAGNLAQGRGMSLWLAGLLSGAAVLALLPILLGVLTFILLAAFGLL
jgi:hypothetical protein